MEAHARYVALVIATVLAGCGGGGRRERMSAARQRFDRTMPQQRGLTSSRDAGQ